VRQGRTAASGGERPQPTPCIGHGQPYDARMPRQDPSAALARRYIAATLGLREDVVEPWDTGGRQGAYDLRYKHHGRVVAVEAKGVVDYDFRLMGARIGRSPYTPEPRLDRLWIVDLRHGADVQAARRGLPDILAHLEARGWNDQLAYRAARWAGLADDLDRLGVTGMWSQPPTEKHPPGSSCIPNRWGHGRQRSRTCPRSSATSSGTQAANWSRNSAANSAPPRTWTSGTPSCWSAGNTLRAGS
jgi:hypothetical protein